MKGKTELTPGEESTKVDNYNQFEKLLGKLKPDEIEGVMKLFITEEREIIEVLYSAESSLTTNDIRDRIIQRREEAKNLPGFEKINRVLENLLRMRFVIARETGQGRAKRYWSLNPRLYAQIKKLRSSKEKRHGQDSFLNPFSKRRP